MNIRHYIQIASLAAILAACSEDDCEYVAKQKQPMRFGVGIEQVDKIPGTRSVLPDITSKRMEGSDNPVFVQMSAMPEFKREEPVANVRGTEVTTEMFHDSFMLLEYEYEDTKSWADISSTLTPLRTVEVLKSKGWVTGEYWPGKGTKMSFIGYAPKATGTVTVTNDNFTWNYTVPTVAAQKDLVVSQMNEETTDVPGDANKTVSMSFKHILSAVQFKIGSTMAPGTITEIKLSGIYSTGTYDLKTGEWTLGTTTQTHTLTPNYEIENNRNVAFTGYNNDLLMLMPQTLPEGAKLYVTIKSGTKSTQMEVPIAGQVWKPGQTVTYTLSTAAEDDQYILTLSAPSNVAAGGGSSYFNVTSYKQTYYGAQIPVGWKAEYSYTDDDSEMLTEPDDVVTSLTQNLPTPTAATNRFSYTIARNIRISSPNYTNATKTLRNAAEKGSEENPYNLASASGGATVENTANCYVVHAGGYYKFPVVYGNAIKNSGNNTAVYGEDKPTFVNSLGNAITAPYLVDNAGISPAEAVISWQDNYRLVEPQSVKLSDDGRWISFKVNKDYICQGNCIIAVRDASSGVLWSWHIWVTDFDLSTDAMTNSYSTVYDFMRYPVGFCDTDIRVGNMRQIMVKITQTEGPEIKAVRTIIQSAIKETYNPTAVYYQWGRKDPMFGYNPGKVLFDVTYPFERQAARPTIAEAITHPSTFYSNSSKAPWASELSQELWDVGHTGTAHYDENPEIADGHSVVKTIYDPSPVGFKAPPPAAFNNFKNSRQSLSKNGTWFYSLPGKKGSIVFWHALGNINVNGNVSDYNSVGRYWTTGNYTENCSHSWRLWFGSNSANADYVESYVGGHIRPIKE